MVYAAFRGLSGFYRWGQSIRLDPVKVLRKCHMFGRWKAFEDITRNAVNSSVNGLWAWIR